MPKQEDAPLREKTLHELNMEQRAIDRANRVPEEENVLAKLPADIRRSVAKRLQKPVRAPVKAD